MDLEEKIGTMKQLFLEALSQYFYTSPKFKKVIVGFEKPLISSSIYEKYIQKEGLRMGLSEKNLWLINALDKRKEKKIQSQTRAAVLIPIYERNQELCIIFTKRTNNVRYNKGDISFPGGVCENGDAGIEATALREAFEEIGIRPEDVRILGKIDDFESISGYIVTPVVGLISPDHCFTLNRVEVERIIEVPVANLSETEGEHGAEYIYKTDRIWGLTARILKQLLSLEAKSLETELKRDSKRF